MKKGISNFQLCNYAILNLVERFVQLQFDWLNGLFCFDRVVDWFLGPVFFAVRQDFAMMLQSWLPSSCRLSRRCSGMRLALVMRRSQERVSRSSLRQMLSLCTKSRRLSAAQASS